MSSTDEQQTNPCTAGNTAFAAHLSTEKSLFLEKVEPEKNNLPSPVSDNQQRPEALINNTSVAAHAAAHVPLMSLLGGETPNQH